MIRSTSQNRSIATAIANLIPRLAGLAGNGIAAYLRLKNDLGSFLLNWCARIDSRIQLRIHCISEPSQTPNLYSLSVHVGHSSKNYLIMNFLSACKSASLWNQIGSAFTDVTPVTRNGIWIALAIIWTARAYAKLRTKSCEVAAS